mmetsp:Transcript_3242/g.7337  ORF Transcript_3242/g.7337 Transcript_3242/m.7337 type:complete len:256 (+) Transcript_3242:927-1694(+)
MIFESSRNGRSTTGVWQTRSTCSHSPARVAPLAWVHCRPVLAVPESAWLADKALPIFDFLVSPTRSTSVSNRPRGKCRKLAPKEPSAQRSLEAFWGDTLVDTLAIWSIIWNFCAASKSCHLTPTLASDQREEDSVYALNFLILSTSEFSSASFHLTSDQRAPMVPRLHIMSAISVSSALPMSTSTRSISTPTRWMSLHFTPMRARPTSRLDTSPAPIWPATRGTQPSSTEALSREPLPEPAPELPAPEVTSVPRL